MEKYIKSNTKDKTKKLTTPFISIIIPVYNVEKYISRCLESCINQSFSDIEILLIDDCGNDNSISIAKSFAKKDCRIRIIKNEKNLGLFHTRIVGEKEAKGLYLLHLDSDDYIDYFTCKILYRKVLDKNVLIENINIIYGGGIAA
ncbi:hypothetical protein CQA42_01940 [Helicobacter sp. MIT 99-5507]|nr:hypothetical protein CQA42_01940 [Helicobacter sp. MIT 99-5507]